MKKKIPLKLEALAVTSFTTAEPTISGSRISPFCCTGCVSGCGINPTAGYCESGGGDDGTILVY